MAETKPKLPHPLVAWFENHTEPNKGECVFVNGHFDFLKTVRRDLHFHRKLNAWGFSLDIVVERVMQCRHIILHDIIRDDYYVTLPEAIGRMTPGGLVISRYTIKRNFVDRSGNDHGVQLFVPISRWNRYTLEELLETPAYA